MFNEWITITWYKIPLTPLRSILLQFWKTKTQARLQSSYRITIPNSSMYLGNRIWWVHSNVMVVVLFYYIRYDANLPPKEVSANAVHFCMQFVVGLPRFIIYLYLYYPQRNLYVKCIWFSRAAFGICDG